MRHLAEASVGTWCGRA